MVKKVTSDDVNWCIKNLTFEEDLRLQELLPSIRGDRRARIIAALLYLKLNEIMRSKNLNEAPLDALTHGIESTDASYLSAKKALIVEGLISQSTENYFSITTTPYFC